MSLFSHRPRRAAWALAAVAAASMTLGACGSSPAASSTSTLTVTDAYVNEPTVPERTGAFGVIANSGTTEIRLVGASVPADVAESAAVHETVMKDGAMAMQEVVGGVPVPAGGQLVLKSGGYHVMLMMPKVTLDQVVPLTLTFSDGTSLTTEAPVKAPQVMPSSSASSSM